MFLEFGWYPLLAKSTPKFGTYLLPEHRDYPWLLQLPCPAEGDLTPGAVRALIEAAGITEEQYVEAFSRLTAL